MNRSFLLPLVLLAAGCVAPRTTSLGMTASALGPSNHEVAVSTGFGWATQTAAPITSAAGNQTVFSYAVTSGASISVAEGNAQFGLNKHLGLNFHLSPAGIQPGVKITFLDRNVALGMLPELGVGYFTGGTRQVVFTGQNRTDSDPAYSNQFVFLAGARFLISHPGSGFYAGLGYQYQLVSAGSTTGIGQSQVKSSSTDTLHNLLVAVGVEFQVGSLRIRPEVATAITPEISTSVTTNGAVTNRAGGNGFFIFPNVTFAMAGSTREVDRDEDEQGREEAAPKKKGRKKPQVEEDDDSSDSSSDEWKPEKKSE